MKPLDADELRALVAEVAAALEAITNDAESAEETDFPLSDELLKQLRQRDAFVAVMKAVGEEESLTKKQWRERFEKALPEQHRNDSATGVPLMPEVKTGAADALELVRRAGLVDRGLADALRLSLSNLF